MLVLVDDFDLAAIAALRYARSLRPTALRAVHFVIDQPDRRQIAGTVSRIPRSAAMIIPFDVTART